MNEHANLEGRNLAIVGFPGEKKTLDLWMDKGEIETIAQEAEPNMGKNLAKYVTYKI